jgi:hypothetical protein
MERDNKEWRELRGRREGERNEGPMQAGVGGYTYVYIWLTLCTCMLLYSYLPHQIFQRIYNH